MDLANLSSCKETYEEIQEKGNQKISASDQILDMKSYYSFAVDMEPFSHHANKDLTHSSRINMERSLSRKGSQVRAEKKMNSNFLMNDGDGDTIPTTKASMMATMPEKFTLVNQTTDQIPEPQVHHQITIMTSGNTSTTKPAGTPTKSSLYGKRSMSFKQSSIINPRRILFFFATLSSMGTILLIWLTLSMAKYDEDDNSHATNLT
ncbi:hypothetical protein L2E82_15207 [Cichorium intybus]|uniref:Uncharacterized protein n=1 Tax=Cichorium intybus TaxID=13427 RepID=A0ACB9F274_CICIN|nr:hypothetical protein L2E82_15207 [Cichorium intybus]